jgi:DNA mismatch endonuclease, patch repair protein
VASPVGLRVGVSNDKRSLRAKMASVWPLTLTYTAIGYALAKGQETDQESQVPGMGDILDSKKRSALMSSIRGRGNKSTELAMVAMLRQFRISGWRRHRELRPRPSKSDIGHVRLTRSRRIKVRPDFVFQNTKVAIFVDGCFWHRCPQHYGLPQQNAEYWKNKLDANVRRDAVHTRALEGAGWTVLRIWEHEMSDAQLTMQRVLSALSR